MPITWFIRLVLMAVLLVATATPAPGAEPNQRKEMARPFDHPVLQFWIKTTKAPSYDKAFAHYPQFQDKQLWPDELSMDGEPAYRQQKWEPTRLLIWNRRDPDQKSGSQVNLMDPANWLENGQPAKRPPDAKSDIVFPSHAAPYHLRNSHGDRFQNSIKCRHITVGTNANISVFGCDPTGNWWIKKGGKIYERHGGAFSGATHAFARNDNVPAYRPGLGVIRPAKWSTEQAPLIQEISQYIHMRKPDGSLEAVGNWGSQDQFHVDAGTFIVGPLSAVGTGGRATLVVHGEGILQLQSGSVISKGINQSFNWDAVIEGVLRAGSPDRPFRKDAMLGLSAKDYVGEVDNLKEYGDRLGLAIKGNGVIETHPAQGSNARLVFAWHGIDLAILRDAAVKTGDREYDRWMLAMQGALHMPRTITLRLSRTTQLENVAFDDVQLGGIQGVTSEQVAQWKNIEWRSGNQGDAQWLIAPCNWLDNVVTRQGWPVVQIPAGQPLMLDLRSPVIGASVHYTTDGQEPTKASPIAKGPIKIERMAMVKARAYVADRPQGPVFRVDCVSQDVPAPADQGGDQPGLKFTAGAWLEDQDRIGPGKDRSEPATGTVPSVTAKPADQFGADGNRVVELAGFLNAPVGGTYDLRMTADGPARAEMFLGQYRILSIDDRSQDASCRVALAKGPHAIVIQHRRAWWGSPQFQLEWRVPGMEQSQDVPASAWTH